jgi:bacteriocin-like protein
MQASQQEIKMTKVIASDDRELNDNELALITGGGVVDGVVTAITQTVTAVKNGVETTYNSWANGINSGFGTNLPHS